MKKWVLIVFVLFTVSIMKGQEKQNYWPEQSWAVGMALRTASIPFKTDTTSVSTLVTLFFYEGEYFYLRGIEGGIKFYKKNDWQFSALGRLRFFDFPKQYQNQIQGDNMEWGLQAKYNVGNIVYADLELLTDWDGHISSNIRLGRTYNWDGFRVDPFLELKLKTKKYNSYYYGLTLIDINGGMDIAAGAIADYHVGSNFYFFGAAKLTYFDSNVRNSEFIRDKFHGQIFLGFGFSNNPLKPRKEKLNNKAYVRVGQGFATPSDLNKILKMKAVKDTNNNKMTSFFYGHPLTDELLGIPLQVYLTPGIVYHWPSDVQTESEEFVVAVKLYYTIPLPLRIRLGAGEGISYITKPTYLESNEMNNKGYRPSNLMNYLDFSVDINIGDILGNDDIKRLWLGYYIHHRSSIFELAQQFGRIKGGSNYQTIYVMWEL